MKYLVLLIPFFISCNSIEMQKEYTKEANSLINETSPYLLQHAYNPVDWHPWNKTTLEKAKKENKPLLISIGYSACHWCHVMEKESFEDSLVAEIMNKNFICIKVDREERPDIDQIYMNAVQLMLGKGGWPLNCFATADGRPFYGGTYFPKENWIDILTQLTEVYKNDYKKVEEYANKLTEGIISSDIIERQEVSKEFSIEVLKEGLNRWTNNFDKENGGNNSAPKFPMPNNYEFLLQYASISDEEDILEHVYFTLNKMAYGGLYDQIGGGFARYSTDMLWKVPHFEKMLYDNAQLISLYSKAYKKSKNPDYKKVVNQTISFVLRELSNEEGAFYSALDADSEGEEGKFYVWEESELQEILKEDYPFVKSYYSIGKEGYWEDGKNILVRNPDIKLEGKDQKKVDELNKKLFKVREQRVRPGLDDKSLTSWNAMMCIGLLDAYETFGESQYLTSAEKNLHFLRNKQWSNEGALWHSYKNNNSTIEGFLDDYSYTIEALIKAYENTFNEDYLNDAKSLVDYCIENFYDDKSGLFFYTSIKSESLIARKKETEDNVIPASNSSMAKALYKLSEISAQEELKAISLQMLSNMQSKFNTYLPAYTNWAQLLLWESNPFYEIVIIGKDAEEYSKKLKSYYLPNKVLLGSKNVNDETKLELLDMKWVENKTIIYVCENKSCQMPVNEVSEALKQLDN